MVDAPSYRFKVNGLRNPVRAALMYVQAMGLPIDVESFKRTADVIGDSLPDVLADGFLVQNLSDLERLCDLGKFVVGYVDGNLVCCPAAEWKVDGPGD